MQHICRGDECDSDLNVGALSCWSSYSRWVFSQPRSLSAPSLLPNHTPNESSTTPSALFLPRLSAAPASAPAPDPSSSLQHSFSEFVPALSLSFYLFFFFVYGECVVFICPVIWITKNEFLTRVLFSFPPPPFFEMQPQTMTQRSLCFRFQSVVHAVTLLVISDTEAPKYLWL